MYNLVRDFSLLNSNLNVAKPRVKLTLISFGLFGIKDIVGMGIKRLNKNNRILISTPTLLIMKSCVCVE